MRLQVTPFDLRWAYVDTTRKLWNEPRPEYVQAASVGSDFLLVRRRAPRALDGASFLLSRCLIDQHVMHKDAYVIPFWLATESADAEPGSTVPLFDHGSLSGTIGSWRPNLSERAHQYLSDLGIADAMTSQSSASLIWQHALAIGYSPLYLEENGDAIRNGWPRIPLPHQSDQLASSARLGQRIADLLDIDHEEIALDGPLQASRRTIAKVTRFDGMRPGTDSGDLAVTAGWATEQWRQQRGSGVISRVVMPRMGRTDIRQWSDAERDALGEEELSLLGNEVVDVYLNDRVRWLCVPQAVWDFKIGGFQILSKWLSYREKYSRQRPDRRRGSGIR